MEITLQDIKELFTKEWRVIAKAPVISVITLALLGAAIWWGTSKYYTALLTLKDGELKSKDEQLKGKDDQLKGKDDLLAEYRERLHILPPAESPFVRLTNIELQRKALTIIGQLRDLLTQWEEEWEKEIDNLIRSVYPPQTPTPEEGSRRFQEDTQKLVQTNGRLFKRYEEKYRTNVTLLRDEMRARVLFKEDDRSGRLYLDTFYDNPVTSGGLKDIVSDLEQLAKKLPINK